MGSHRPVSGLLYILGNPDQIKHKVTQAKQKYGHKNYQPYLIMVNYTYSGVDK